MKKLLLALLVAALIVIPVPPVQAQSCTGWSNQMVPYDAEAITVSSASIGFTASKISTTTTTAAFAIFTLETASVRYRVDGVDPTAAVGHLTVVGGTYFVCGAVAVKNFRAIRTTVDGTIFATYFKGA